MTIEVVKDGVREGEMEVRCCCNPERVLGWLPVPAGVRDTLNVFLQGEVGFVAAMAQGMAPPPLVVLQLEIRPVFSRSETHLALKSMHKPVETFRRIRGFRENIWQTPVRR